MKTFLVINQEGKIKGRFNNRNSAEGYMGLKEKVIINSEIIGVTIKHGDLLIGLPKPNRHHNVIHYMVNELGITKPVGHQYDDGQGFYLNDGTYLNRKQALSLAKETNQLKNEEHTHETELFSEDLW